MTARAMDAANAIARMRRAFGSGVARLLSRVALMAFTAGSSSCSGGSGPSLDSGSQAQAFSLDDVARACVISVACNVQPRPRVEGCVEYYANVLRSTGMAPVYEAIYRCVLAGRGDCTRVAACFGAGAPCDRSHIATCRGEVAQTCDLIDKRVYALDCGTGGLTCRVDAAYGFSAGCACDAAFQPRCLDEWVATCRDGAIVTSDCGALGQRCQRGRCSALAPDPRCETPTSSQPSLPACEGSVAFSCQQGGIARRDCAREAQERACVAGVCTPIGSECGRDVTDSCDGSQLRACLDGRWQMFDCTALGLGPCRAHGTWASCSESP